MGGGAADIELGLSSSRHGRPQRKRRRSAPGHVLQPLPRGAGQVLLTRHAGLDGLAEGTTCRRASKATRAAENCVEHLGGRFSKPDTRRFSITAQGGEGTAARQKPCARPTKNRAKACFREDRTRAPRVFAFFGFPPRRPERREGRGSNFEGRRTGCRLSMRGKLRQRRFHGERKRARGCWF